MSYYEDILNLKMDSRDLGTVTIRQYMCELLRELFLDSEAFSGKRPFGNSSWEYDIAACLIKNEYIRGELDEDGCVDEINWDDYHEVIFPMLRHMCGV